MQSRRDAPLAVVAKFDGADICTFALPPREWDASRPNTADRALERFLLDVNRIGHGGFPGSSKSASEFSVGNGGGCDVQRLVEGSASACGRDGRGGRQPAGGCAPAQSCGGHGGPLARSLVDDGHRRSQARHRAQPLSAEGERAVAARSRCPRARSDVGRDPRSSVA